MRINALTTWRVVLCAVALGAGSASADPWVDSIVDYLPGIDPAAGFTMPSAALGEPTRFTNPPPAMFGGVVTPANSSFGVGETVSLGKGGQLTVAFSEPVLNHALNPFGVDLIIFGNSFFAVDFSPSATVLALFAEGGDVELSSDGIAWTPVPGVGADGLFPTNGYADIAEPFTSTPGLVPANFTRPVDPGFIAIGKTFAELIAGYDGSGGGLGIDIGAAGLSSVSYVRITNPLESTTTPEIDAFADVAPVPEPGASTVFVLAAALFAWQNRRRS